MTARYTVKFSSEPFQLHEPADCPGLPLYQVSAPPNKRDNLRGPVWVRLLVAILFELN